MSASTLANPESAQLSATSPDTLITALFRAVRDEQSGLSFLDRREQRQWHSWRSLLQAAIRVSAGIQRQGVRRGQCIGLIFPTGPDFFHAFFGALLAGAVPVPLYPPVRLGRLEEYHLRTAAMLQAVEAPMALVAPRVHRILGETAAATSLPLGLLRLSDLPSQQEDEDSRSLDSGLVGSSLLESGLLGSEEDLALVQFSSGTTVDPKPVALSHRALLAQVRTLNGLWPADWSRKSSTGSDSAQGIDPWRPTGVSWLPLYHDMGLIGCVLAALEIPSRLTLLPPELFIARPALWLRALSATGAEISPAPSFAYSLCVERVRDEELEGVDLSRWRVALNGAEPVAPAVLRAFSERFRPWGFDPRAMTPVYGLAEASLAVTFSRLDSDPIIRRFRRQELSRKGRALPTEAADGVELVSVGRPLPGFDAQIRRADGSPAEAGEVGRLWVRGPSLMEGYLSRPELTREALIEGWLDTGDQGFFDSEGDLFLTGRAKDIVLIRGRNYAPSELEAVMDTVEGVRRGCSVAASYLPEGGKEESLVLLVEAARGLGDERRRKLPEACGEALLAAMQLRAKEVVVLDPGTLPRTSSGKLRRGAALEAWRRGELQAPKRMGWLQWLKVLGRSRWLLSRDAAKRERRGSS
ncbi:MAG: AMP-binding protein [Acidobacteriota bacterium]